ncbi:DoxX family protein, partial [Pseudomonas aeruginosa]|uniref:DoxX family protein n=1 Tax=Pseudomonas aeruginosa TaxID=287 RepID=UPI0031B6B8EF
MNSLRYFDFGTARPVLLLIARIAVVLIFIIFGFPKMMGFDGTVQYMASLGSRVVAGPKGDIAIF